MAKWNEEAAPNNNMASTTIQNSKLVHESNDAAFSEELSDGGERNEIISKRKRK